MVRVRIEGDNDKKLPRVEVGRQGAGGDDTASSKEVNGQSGLSPTRQFPPPSSVKKNNPPPSALTSFHPASCLVLWFVAFTAHNKRSICGPRQACRRNDTVVVVFVISLLGVSKCLNHSVIVQ